MCLYLGVKAQDISTTEPQATLHNGLYLGGQGSTNGWGFNARYTFNNWFSLKTGYETLTLAHDFNFDENSIKYNAALDYQTGGILLLADFNYTKNLYISTGAIFNSFKPKVSGFAASDYKYGDIVISADEIGHVTMTAESGLKVSPYASAGYQAFMGKRDGVVFQFEIGMYYLGSPDLTIEADGLLAPTADPAFGQEKYLEYQYDAYQIYPIIKLGLAFKLF